MATKILAQSRAEGKGLARYIHKFESGGYTLEAIDLENFEQFTIHAAELMDAVVALGEQLGLDWGDI
ncbi:MAG: hypothetical protein IH984_11895 [Planctomycetes bacterium]|nr:hypothetical protein [Planctomycetota bacterium]